MLELPLIERILDEAAALLGDFSVSLTGGEPLLHPAFSQIVAALAARGLEWRIVSNGWHVPREIEAFSAHPPEFVVLSLSGADAAVHDAERGRESFARVLMAIGALRSRGIAATLSMVVDQRDRHQLEDAARLAAELGVIGIDFILPQPVPGSVTRDSDLAPEAWAGVRDDVQTLRARYEGQTAVTLAYGAPTPHGTPEPVCATKQLQRIYIDPDGRMSLCCQMSDYGSNRADVVADLHHTSLADAFQLHGQRMMELRRDTRRKGTSIFDELPCIRCAAALGKLHWLAGDAQSAWSAAPDALAHHARGRSTRVLPVLAS